MRYVFAGCLVAWAAAAAGGEPLAVEEFFKRPQYTQVDISPGGRHIAAIVRGRPHDALAVIDPDTKAGGRITNFVDADVTRFIWLNDRRLLFAVGDAYEPLGDRCSSGWYAVNSDGSDLVLIEAKVSNAFESSRRAPGSTVPSVGLRTIPGCGQPNLSALHNFRLLQLHPYGSDEIVFEASEFSRRTLDVYRFNTKTAEMTLLSTERPSSKVWHWIVDRDAVPRVAVSHDEGISIVWYRDGPQRPWIKLHEGPLSKPDIDPLAFDFDNRTLYVGFPEQGDKTAIYKYDFEKRQLGERVARHLDVDMGVSNVGLDSLIFNSAKRALVGFSYDADKHGVIWLDAEIAKLQKIVDQALPATVNVLRPAEQNAKRALVISYSDVVPAEYYVLDIEKNALRKFAASRPWINPKQMSERKFVRYKARDGMAIPAYLTIPKDSAGKSLPLVVYVHDGPYATKQRWNFDSIAQFLASRGYAVLQPDFRGTIGYGWRHLQSSFKQWGLSMQDDITDGVEWLVRDGIADKNRICIYGRGYGGYATLWGLMKTPDLYRCGVAFSPITDIGLYFEITWSAAYWSPFEWLDYGAKELVGDPVADRDKFNSVSPIYQVERLKAPTLIAFGGGGWQVPLKHGNAFRDALDRHAKKYEWVLYPHEGYDLGADENRFDFFRRVETFLKQQLQPTEPAPQH